MNVVSVFVILFAVGEAIISFLTDVPDSILARAR